MHPYIQHLAEKDEHTFEEASIIGAARIIEQEKNPATVAHYRTLLNQWLRQLNPHKLSGPAIGEWADKITAENGNGLQRISKASSTNTESSDS